MKSPNYIAFALLTALTSVDAVTIRLNKGGSGGACSGPSATCGPNYPSNACCFVTDPNPNFLAAYFSGSSVNAHGQTWYSSGNSRCGTTAVGGTFNSGQCIGGGGGHGSEPDSAATWETLSEVKARGEAIPCSLKIEASYLHFTNNKTFYIAEMPARQKAAIYDLWSVDAKQIPASFDEWAVEDWDFDQD